jgi:feruloyl esterase
MAARNAKEACAALAGRAIAGVASITASMVAASGDVPSYCRVKGTIAPRLDFELRLPESWNAKLHYGGGGGYNGAIPALAGPNLAALKAGYATVSSDSGHQADSTDASFALHDMQAAQLFGSLSVPTVMTATQEILRTAYGAASARSYFEGCSNGGREGLMSVQRYPDVFDGVIARAPAYNWVGVMGAFHRNARALAAPGGQLSPDKVRLVATAVRNVCDGLDGIADRVVSNPRSCAAAFDPASLRCAGGANPGNTCLSDAELGFVTTWTATAAFAGSPTYRNAGWNLTGNEDEPQAWRDWVTGEGNYAKGLQFLFSDTTIKNYLARDPMVDSITYTYDQDPGALHAFAALNDATATDLRAFSNRGGKLILWHGGSDAALSVNATIEYYSAVSTAMGGPAVIDGFMRLYVAPGVNHCSGGRGADTSDLLGALDSWVMRGTAPQTLTAQRLATTGSVLLSRPLCRYPQYPRYNGPANDPAAEALAANYFCTVD